MNDLKTNWFINALLAVIVVLLASTYSGIQGKSAQAAGPGGGTAWDGVMIGASNVQERLVLVDTQKLNIMIYHAQKGGKFGLNGARNYRYDLEMLDAKIPGTGWNYFETLTEYHKKK